MNTQKVVVARMLFGMGAAVFAAASAVALGHDSPNPQSKSTSPAATQQYRPASKAEMAAKQQAFLAAHPESAISEHRGDTRVYGLFANGASAVASAESFKNSHMAMFGAEPADLVPEPGFFAGGNTQPLMYNRDNGTYKFTAVYYTQQRDGVPVYGSRLVVLTRNEPGFPAVLANPDIRPLGNFRVTPQQAAAPMPNAALQTIAAQIAAGADINVLNSQRVIWAGTQQAKTDPVLADNTVVQVNGYDDWRYITHAGTGAILETEHLICFGAPVNGTARGMATEGMGAEMCENEIPQVLKYLRVTSGVNSAVTNASGNYTIDPDGPTINAVLDGTYFDVVHFTGTNTSVSIPVSSPADLLFNSANSDPTVRSQVNLYVEANKVRDYTLVYNPAYPFVSTQVNFPARANRVDGFCPANAWYSSSDQSINFCLAGGGSPNTAFSSVIYHEYGHRIVNAAGSGQGAYGEGTGDVMSVLVLDDPRISIGFFNNCNGWLRDASLPCQYQTTGCSSCGSEAHDCGQLIAGCVWSTRNQLLASNPGTYRDLLSDLAINAILLHTGTAITPQITVDWLTLDDDVPPIGNGTPHYNEIATGFGAHNMPAPPLTLLGFTFPNGQPSFVHPDGSTTIPVNVFNNGGPPIPGTGVLFVNTGSGFQPYPMTETSANQYLANVPSSPCGTSVKYYFRATAQGGVFQYSPTNAPASFYTSTSAFGITPSYNDTFQTDTGWATSFNWSGSGTPTGHWERAVPFPPGNSDTPSADADGSGMCYVTGNSAGNDVDQGIAVLTSPLLDASENHMVLSYYRWFDTSVAGADNFIIEYSLNGGGVWNFLEIVQPIVTGSWVLKTYDLDSLGGFVPTNQFQLRFRAFDQGSDQTIEAAVDGIKIEKLVCANPCPADVAGDDGVVNITDLLFVVSHWGGGAGDPADVNGDNTVNITDLLLIVSSWGACP